MDFDKKSWLLQSKIRFLLKPTSNRVCLEISTDGRHLPYLIVSLHALGYGIQVVESPMLFRELFNLRESTPIPILFGGQTLKCGLLISDCMESVAKARDEGIKAIFLDYDFFGKHTKINRMPYFMHPSVYYQGLHHHADSNSERERPIRIGFFGTRDANFYKQNFQFPMMNREQILESFFARFVDQVKVANASVSGWKKQQIVASLDDRGGDHSTKTFLPLSEYLGALRKCDFFLSPPGWCMPLSHNLIEGMAAGAIPIINSSEYLYPALEHSVNCLTFSTAVELKATCEEALAMSSKEIEEMRRNVTRYYEVYLKPGNWLIQALSSEAKNLLVNAEELSILQ